MPNILYSDEVIAGPIVKPLIRVYAYSDKEWEEFIEEWLDIKRKDYVEVEQIGGAGDMGRDVIAYINKDKPNYKWDCYQCKHYKKAIAPNEIYVELGKIVYYTFEKKFPIPERYYIVAPRGVGRSLGDLLNTPEELKSKVRENWNNKCKTGITSTEEIELNGDLLNYFNEFDFSIFERVLPKSIIEEFEEGDRVNYIKRFGGGLPTRETVDSIPEKTQKYELKYTSQLLKAYNTDKDTNEFQTEVDLFSSQSYTRHFKRARESFHNAEQLRNFSRDNLGEDIFESFQNEIYERIVDIIEETKDNKFDIVKQAEQKAMDVPIESNPLKTRCNVVDKKGMCHQLVNDEKIYWVEDEE